MGAHCVDGGGVSGQFAYGDSSGFIPFILEAGIMAAATFARPADGVGVLVYACGQQTSWQSVDSASLVAGIRSTHCNVQNIAATAIAITNVASHPNILSLGVMGNAPIISGRTAISIITAIIGTEITPLITALQ